MYGKTDVGTLGVGGRRAYTVMCVSRRVDVITVEEKN